jgi:peptidoglycan/xylan/chitin deacetylase (PgdA/CDA1 family)
MKRLTFTFDNGPCPGATEAVLEFLAERSIKATFFLVGAQLADGNATCLAKLAHSQGHWIGNHTFSHSTPLGLDGSRERVEREIGDTQRCLGDLAHPRKFFRPNGGGTAGPHLLSPEAVDYIQENRFTLVTWNSVPGDWKEPHEDWLPRAIRDLERQDWTVLVLHDQYIASMIGLLSHFHDELVRRGISVVQDFPSSCVPIEMGTVRGDLSGIAGSPTAAAADEFPRPALRSGS